MTRRAIMTTGVLLVLLVLLSPVAVSAPGSDPSASGSSHLTVHGVFGLDTLILREFGFTARLASDGSADGWFDYRDVGNDAWIGATIRKSNEPTFVGLGGWWHVTDNGQGAGSSPDITTFLGVGSLEQTAAFCEDHPPFRFPFPIDGGDIQVRD